MYQGQTEFAVVADAIALTVSPTAAVGAVPAVFVKVATIIPVLVQTPVLSEAAVPFFTPAARSDSVG